jgi:nucleoside-diphosphate-sugar epimerase
MKVIKEFKPEVVVHLAAKAVASYCDSFPMMAYKTNIDGLTNMLIASKGVVKRFVFVSSSFVYGDFRDTPVPEAHPKNPIGIYGGCKLAGEYLTKTYCNRFGMDWVIIRPSAVYGAGDRNKRVVQTFIERALNNKPLVLEGADQLIDFTYINDTVQGLWLATVKDTASKQEFNITRGEGRSLKELAQIIKVLLPKVVIEEREADCHRPKRGALDIAKASLMLGYKPEYSLEQGVPLYYDWVRGYGY